jgi:hypothetical protein
MSKKKVISILEFLRTGTIFGIAVNASVDDVFGILGRPDYVWASPDVPTATVMGYGDLEFWFHTESKVLNRMKFKLWPNKLFSMRGTKIDPWVIHTRLDIETAKRFLKTARLEYEQSVTTIGIMQLDLPSGVTMLFDPLDSSAAMSLAYLGIQRSDTDKTFDKENIPA